MDLTISPGHPISGRIGEQGSRALPGDKSISHRAALFAALAEGESVIENFLVSGVTKAMLGALSALGVSWELEDDRLTVHGRGLPGLRAPAHPIDCGNSATTLRLLTGALAAVGIPAVLDGSDGLRRRPMSRIVIPLRRMGVKIEASEEVTAPLRLEARPAGTRLIPLMYHLPVASAQVKTCLLLAGLAADGDTVLWEPAPSRDHTERLMASMGVQIAVQTPDPSTSVQKPSKAIVWLSPKVPLRLSPLNLSLPGDISAAAFLIVAALITPGSTLIIEKVGLNPLRTGMLDALEEMGAKIRIANRREQGGEPIGDLEVEYSSLKGISVSGSNVVRMIDEFPALAIAAAYARGETVVKNAEELRFKESDRIVALCQELRRLGIAAEETADGFRIWGGTPVQGGVVQPAGDHRLAMALAVAGLAAQAPITVQGAQVIGESYPGFSDVLNYLGAEVSEG